MIDKPTPPPSQRFKEGHDPVPNVPCRDIIHFEFKSLHPMDHRQERYVELLIKAEKRFLWLKWIKSYRFIVPRQNLVMQQEMEWYLHGTKKKY